jgi:predicted nucleic acid-binding protein
VVQVVHRSWQSGQFLAPAPIYLDASITVAWLTSADLLHARAAAFLADHLAASRELVVSLLTVDETIFRLLRGLVAQSRGQPIGRIALGREMKQNPNLLRAFLPNLRMAIGYLTAWATLTGSGTATPQQVLDSWLDRCNDVGGLHDAAHLSLAEHSGARTFVTGDGDVKRVTSLPVPMYVIVL